LAVRKYNQFYTIMSAIKRCFSRSPTHKAAMDAAKCARKKGPRGGARYRCAKCRKDFSAKEVQVDHIQMVVPLGTLSKDMSWDELVNRIFCSEDNLQILCTKCHTKKSKEENAERRAIKNAKSN